MEEIRNFEWNRQVFHAFLGIFIVILLRYNLIDKQAILAITAIGLALSLLSKRISIPLIGYFLEKFERKHEMQRLPGRGVLFYFIGIYLSLFLFTKEIAMASIMILALGDSVSHVFGLHYGKIKHPLSQKKFLEGAIAGFVAGFLGAKIFLPWHEAFFASLFAMVVEAIEINVGTERIDDNLIIPVIAGLTVSVIRYF